MFKKMTALLVALLLCSSLVAQARDLIRATELGSNFLTKIQKEEIKNVTIEFRVGDRLPITIRAEGDLFESVDNNPTFIEIKKTFFVRIDDSNVAMSFDGEIFKPFTDFVGGSLSIGASSEESDPNNFPAGAINVLFKSYIK
jgi:hypothetical protein